MVSKRHESSPPTDFFRSNTDEPHAIRRQQILAKYPQVKELYGHDPSTKYLVVGWVTSQFLVGYLLQDSPWWLIVAVAYCFGGFSTHALVLAMHEISHNLAFEKSMYNRLLGCFANLATALPHFSMFQQYHLEHHRFQGVSGIDSDLPSNWEAKFFSNTPLKIVWLFFQPVWYVTRPLLMKPKTPGFWEAINWTSTLLIDALIFYFFGGKFLAYMFLSIFLGCGLHPVAGHFIAEHYVFVSGQETYSYYGPLNHICFNVGYHNEHHDFPRIPGSRLPRLKAMAPEFYDNLPSYNSWAKVLWDFATDSRVSPFCRVVRQSNKFTRAKEAAFVGDEKLN